jgi:restriction system protein
LNKSRKPYRSYRLPKILADQAMKKLYEDEELTAQEVEALFQSDYLSNVKVEPESEAELFVQTPIANALTSNVSLIDTEVEVFSYFARYPEMLYSISPRKFEELVAAIFKNNGFQVELTPETRDGGMDIIAVRKDIITGGALHLIECKRYIPENKVAIGVVQRMMGVVEMKKATQGIIVTTSDFSRDAREAASTSKHRLSLNSFEDLKVWLRAIEKK